jgi:DNA-binding MarR family transcriptional regulator
MATKKSISDLESHLGYWLRYISNHVSHRFAQRLEQSGVTVAEWVVLREMFDVETLAPSILSEKTGLTRGAISKLIERLRAKKLVTRTEVAEDRRFQDVGLTVAGRALVPKLAALADANDAEFFAHLTAAQRKQFMATLKKLVQANGLSKIPTE